MRQAKSGVLLSQLKIAGEIWGEIQNEHSPADRWLANYFHRHRKKIGSRDRRFLSETVYALFRHKSFLEVWAKVSCHAENSKILSFYAAASEGFVSAEEFQELAPSYLGQALHQAPPYEALIQKNLPEGIPFESLEHEWSLKFSFPIWLIERWRARFGTLECKALLEALQMRPPLVIRANPLKISRPELIKRFKKQGYPVRETEKSSLGIVFRERVSLFDSEEFRNGFFEIQDEGSQLICEQIDPKPGEIIWDVCAGGGGKSLALAALMKNKGRIIATDIRKWKLEDLKKRARRAGIYNIFPADLERIEEIREMREGVDKILVDAPCSGTGTLRRNPDAKWKLEEAGFLDYQKDQIAILEKALPHLKKCGKLYYVTCSLEPTENEEVSQVILERYPGLRKIENPGSPDGFFRLMPHRDGTDGFFMAAVRNKEDLNLT